MSASVLSGSPAVVSVPASAPQPVAQGTATIALGAKVVAVALPQITASSVIMAWGIGAIDATATSIDVDNLVAGVGFSITTNANATAAKSVGWAVLKY